MSPKRPYSRQSAKAIAARRARVALLDRFAFGPSEIVEMLRREPDFVAQADDYNTVIDDLRRLRQKQRAALAKGVGIEALAEYVNGLQEIRRLAFLAHEDATLSDTARLAALELALICQRDIGRAYGIPVDADPGALSLSDRHFRLSQDDIRLEGDDLRLEEDGLHLDPGL